MSSSRKLPRQESFNPNLDSSHYTSENISDLIKTAGNDVYQKYQRDLEAYKTSLMNGWLISQGVDPTRYDAVNPKSLTGDALAAYQRWYAEITALRTSHAKKGEYKKPLAEYRYNYLRDLDDQRRIGSLAGLTVSNAAAIGVGKGYTKEDIKKLYNGMSRDAFLEWLSTQNPLGFNTNALEEAIKMLGIRNRSRITSKGDEKKRDFFNLIMGQSNRPLSTGGILVDRPISATTVAIPYSANLADELARRGIISAGQLNALLTPQLKELASLYKVEVAKPKNKPQYIEALAAAAGFQALRSEATVLREVNDIIDLAGTDPRRAREMARRLDPDELKMHIKGDKIKQLAKAIQLSKEYPQKTNAPSVDLIISTMTGRETSQRFSRRSREHIKTSLSACAAAPFEDVKIVADQMNIPTVGMSQEQLCDRIYAAYLGRLSSLTLARDIDIRNIAEMTGDAQRKEVAALARTIGLTNVDSLDSLLQQWLRNHYISRAITYYPEAREDVIRFLDSGRLPDDEYALGELAAVFSDVNKDTYRASVEDRRRSLNSLYNQLVRRLNVGGPSSAGAFLTNVSRFGFNPAYSSRSRSPVRSYTSPTRDTTSPVQTATPPLSPTRGRSTSPVRMTSSVPPMRATSPSRATSPVQMASSVPPRRRSLSMSPTSTLQQYAGTLSPSQQALVDTEDFGSDFDLSGGTF